MTESELLFTQALNCDRAALRFNKDKHLTSEQSFFISSVLKRRATGEPIQYILGKAEFMGLEFIINEDVLIPRPDTEILVEAVLKYAGSLPPDKNRILELGTGSGCIAVSLAKFLPAFKITATDISLKALMAAKSNASLNKVAGRITFLLSDLFSSLSARGNKYSICVSNPPYIASGEIDKLQPEIKYEPRVALDGGSDGLKLYRKIIKESSGYFKSGCFLVMEIGYSQRKGIEDIFSKHSPFNIVEVIKDYNNLDRVIVARKG
jgi:release factor glutamine methyltransferase